MLRVDLFIVVLLLNLMLNGTLLAQTMQQYNREHEIAKKLAYVADADEIIHLQTLGTTFIGIYASARTEEAIVSQVDKRGCVILLHGIGGHPDWPDVILPLRTKLTGFGWSTLSIQMPILAVEEPVSQYGGVLPLAQERIQAAVDYLDMWGVEPLVLLGYGFGAAQAASYLANDQYARSVGHIKAFVSVSILAQKFLQPKLDLFELIGDINIPMLDIYGEDDLQDIRWAIDDRRLAASKNRSGIFRQIELKHAAHHYLGAEQALVEHVQDWLRQVVLAVDENEVALPDYLP